MAVVNNKIYEARGHTPTKNKYGNTNTNNTERYQQFGNNQKPYNSIRHGDKSKSRSWLKANQE